MATLLLVRHGQSQWNLENRFTGQTDVDLTPQGEAEARQAGRQLVGLRFSAAFTSKLRRARRTLALILEETGQTGVPVHEDAALNERSYGALEGLNKAQTAARYGPERVSAWRRSYEAVPPGGESLADTARRVVSYYQARIAPLLQRDGVVLVVAHGNSLRALMMHLEKIAPADVGAVEIPTGKVRAYRTDSSGTPGEGTWL
jgi:2,3-bisphosphoglycerate-dependent phosphoglycerate mutase